MDKLREESREQFEEWVKFHSDEEECTNLLQMNNAGTNYLHPHTDLAWIAWKESRASIVVELPFNDIHSDETDELWDRAVESCAESLRSIGLSIKGE
jgi:hypothetical protein